MVMPEDLNSSQIGGLAAALFLESLRPWLINGLGFMPVTHRPLSPGSSLRVGLDIVI